MSAPTLRQIMAGLATRMQTIPGLNVPDTGISSGQITPPAAIIGVPAITNYHATFGRARGELAPTITVLTSTTMDQAGQLLLADYADHSGSSSVAAAVAADQTLGGVVEWCVVDDFRPLGLEEVGLLGYYGGVFSLRLMIGP